MKQTIKLTESELRNIISNIVNEVKYGGESFHGDNPVDWAAMRDLRYYSDEPLKNYKKGSRNFNHYQDFFDKEYGKYKRDDGEYEFPDKGEYDRAEDWIGNVVKKSNDKSMRAAIGARDAKSGDNVKILQQIVSNHEPFYTKQWQQNGYYPITKWEYDEGSGCYTATWGEHVRNIPLGDVVSAATRDDIFTPEQFTDEHQYKEDGVEWYYIYHANVDGGESDGLNEAIDRVIRKYLR